MLDPGDKIIDCPPTFTMYEFDANVNGATVLKGRNLTLDILPSRSNFKFSAIYYFVVLISGSPFKLFLYNYVGF